MEQMLAALDIECSIFEPVHKKIKARYNEYSSTSFITASRAAQDKEEHEDLLGKIKKTKKNAEELKGDYEADLKKLDGKDDDYARKVKKLKSNLDDDLDTEEKKLKKAQNALQELEARLLSAASSGEGCSSSDELTAEWQEA
jgi:DNA repair exonuclease SbcCD ATPase subunit